ncbi:hypothetical protein ZIOFF_039428 [Zingiber officinale]|uniref:UBL3-like ubiquitin domain-containing protein n=1 Tax=Zingiber officinale TaxID=94328 RepID=A0A8J5G282_ZINOF|nr:hypothetical protein ZIOFF_039428 [Zingiber officinale]
MIFWMGYGLLVIDRIEQMPEEDLIELRFRLYDGSDIGPICYSSSSTVAMLKERIIAEWPRGRSSPCKFSSEIYFAKPKVFVCVFHKVFTCFSSPFLFPLFLKSHVSCKKHGTLCNYLELLAIIAFLVPLVKLLRDWGTFEANVQFWDNKKIVPKVANDVKLISAGKVLENNKTIAQCRSPFGEIPAGIITMHVVVQQSSSKIKTEKKIEESPKKTFCSCSIL